MTTIEKVICPVHGEQSQRLAFAQVKDDEGKLIVFCLQCIGNHLKSLGVGVCDVVSIQNHKS